MKKLTLIISALALVLGMSQCKKPNQPTFGGNIATTPKEISFTVNGVGGQKGDFTQEDDVTSVLDYTWRNGDKIYVYSSNNALVADNTTDFSTGHYCGVLDIVSGANTKTATFKGSINVPDLAQTLRFVHFGTGVAISGNETDGFSGSASFATQNGALTGDNSISSKVIALCDKLYDENVSEYAVGSLQVQFGVVRFTLAAFDGTADITVRGLEKNGLTINANGAVVYTDGTNTILGGITEGNKAKYYTALMPKAETTYTFTDGSKTAYKKAGITTGIFYTKTGDVGESVELDNYPEGAIPGLFSVSATQKVYFSKGNLMYQASTQKWRFIDKQWLYLGENGYTEGEVTYNSGNFSATDRATQDKWIDLFRWGTSGWNNGNKYYQPYDYEGSVNEYGPLKDNVLQNLTGDYEQSDWGVHNAIENGGNKAGMWRIFSEPELEYMFSQRDNFRDLFSGGKVDGINGLIVLPDDWSLPTGASFTPTTYSTGSTISYIEYATNVYSIEQWQVMENAGAVFLPSTGYVDGLTWEPNNSFGGYWASTIKNYEGLSHILGYNNQATTYIPYPYFDWHDGTSRRNGYAVRLIIDAK